MKKINNLQEVLKDTEELNSRLTKEVRELREEAVQINRRMTSLKTNLWVV